MRTLECGWRVVLPKKQNCFLYQDNNSPRIVVLIITWNEVIIRATGKPVALVFRNRIG